MVPCGRFRRCARRGRRAWAGRRCSPSRSVPQSPVSACTPSCRFRGRASKRRAWGEPEKRARLENNRGHALASRSPGRVGMRERAHLVRCAGHCAMKSETRCERRGRGWPSASLSSSRESSSSKLLTSPQQASPTAHGFRPKPYYPQMRWRVVGVVVRGVGDRTPSVSTPKAGATRFPAPHRISALARDSPTRTVPS